MIKIDLDDTYETEEIAEDLSVMTFFSMERNGNKVLLKIQIFPLKDPLLPNVFNLAFGPIQKDGDIDDSVKINHADRNKMFSTILLFGLLYLQANPDATIGIDGSNDARAYLYHRMFQTNKTYLNEYFITIGVDWYVRLLRSGHVEVDTNNIPFFKPRPEPFDYQRHSKDLYRYYMFYLKR